MSETESDLAGTVVAVRITKPFPGQGCVNDCEISEENALLGDGFCESCHEYPDGP